jgi:hypothetical protein
MIWWDVLERVPSLEGRIGVFRGLGSEWEDDIENRPEYERDIIEASYHLLGISPHDE